MKIGWSSIATAIRDEVFRPLLGDIDRPVQNPPVRSAPTRLPTLPPGQPSTSYDGALVGANGVAYPAGTPMESVPSVVPNNGPAGKTPILFVNGVGESKDGLTGEMQMLANATGEPVVTVYNATEGMVKDFLQTIGDRFDLGHNKAVDSYADVIYDHVKNGQPIRVAGYSQGGVIASRALADVKQRLMLEDGLSEADAQKRLGLVTCETFAGAANSYPDGPKYVHYTNRLDPVQLFSFHSFGDSPQNPLVHDGAGAVNHGFEFFGWKAHDLGVYLSHYQRLPEA
jgi:hypothetical protein